MAENEQISAKVIGQIALMQSVVAQLPGRVSILNFVVRGLSDIPGVLQVTYDLADHAASPLRENEESYSVQVRDKCFARLRVAVGDREKFSPYIPYLQNFCVVLAVIFEEERQRLAKEALLQNLEKRVLERTRELELEIRERRLAEAELLEKEESLRTTLNSIGDAVISTDVEGRVLRMNPVAEKLTGWPRSEARGHLLAEVFHIISSLTRERCVDPVETVLRTGKIVALANHTVLVARDGTEYQIADSGAPIRADSGDVLGVVLVFRDVTREYALEEQLRQSQKMEAIGQLAGGVAHDFNNMLCGIMGAADMLEKYLPADQPKAVRCHQLILETAERAAALTGQLLAFARKQPQVRSSVDIHERLNDVVALLNSTVDRKVSIRFQPTAGESMVDGDASQLQNIFLNLGLNAAQAMPNGGSLWIRTSNRVLDEAACRDVSSDLSPGPYIEVEFEDCGCGMSPDVLPHIFEPFFTTKEAGKGTGLGLSAVLGSVQQHGGSVVVSSTPGEGTSFQILLPLLTDSENTASLRESPPVSGRGRILVVDDEETLRLIAEEMLKSLGYEVFAAENGKAALELVEQLEPKPDLVLLDMIMPEMDGRECYAQLKKMDPEIRVILSTGFSQDDGVEKLLSAGVNGYIQKPYRCAELGRLIAEVLNRPL